MYTFVENNPFYHTIILRNCNNFLNYNLQGPGNGAFFWAGNRVNTRFSGFFLRMCTFRISHAEIFMIIEETASNSQI